jgi:hypothetical protein
MGWKEWSYAKKGALIGAIVFLVLYATLFIYALSCEGWNCMWAAIAASYAMPTTRVLTLPQYIKTGYLFALSSTFALLSIFIYIGAGMLVGKLIDKIKQRRSIVKKGA